MSQSSFGEVPSRLQPFRLTLIDDWRWVLTRAWSVRFLVIAALLSGVEVLLSVLSAYQVALPIRAGIFAALSGAVTVAAMIARFVAQQKGEGDGR